MAAVVMFSGGLSSYVAAKRAIAAHGADNVMLLFTDTKTEDPDLYRFLDDCERKLPCVLVRLSEGRDVWQVFHEEGLIGNSQKDICSRVLKREVARKWVKANCDETTSIVIGFNWTELHRGRKAAEAWHPWRAEFPLFSPPTLSAGAIRREVEADGLRVPRLYDLGAPHNNCGGACVKAGHAHWRWLLLTLPEVYAEWESHEQKFRTERGKDVSILKDRRGGVTSPLTLFDFRKRVERQPLLTFEQGVEEEWGGCACFA